MSDFNKVRNSLERLGYRVSTFETVEGALNYLNCEIDNETVGFGGSETVMEMGLYDELEKHNTTYSHHKIHDGKTADEMRSLANSASIYITSANGLSEDGEIINIDGRGNRVASTCYGHKKIYFIIGKNKIAENFDKALWRARNIAGPRNARRVGAKTPCAVKMDKCYNCSSPDRICNELVVFWKKPMGANIEIVLIDENLGY